LDIKATDQSALQEITRLYEATRIVHASLKNQVLQYKSCPPEVTTGGFDRTKHNINLFVHPIVAFLFLAKIKAIEDRMLLANFGRLVSHRSPYNANMNMADNYLQGELEAESVLAYELAKDPHSLAYFNEETPLANLLKRFKIQIELWRNVMNLRQGRFYSTGDFGVDDSVTGFLRTLNSFDWTFFDSPESYQVQDEGTILRKILSVFSIRPTFTQISSLQLSQTGLMTNVNTLAQTSFVNTPIINIRLPPGGTGAPIQLENAFRQNDWYIENKMLVPKNKSIIFSRELAFFYVNRRYHQVNFAEMNMNMGMRYMGMPAMTGSSALNRTKILYKEIMPIGNAVAPATANFKLQSVVTVDESTNNISLGCTAHVVGDDTIWYKYAPHLAFAVNEKGESLAKPIVPTAKAPTPDFQEFGTLFMYTKTA